MRRAQPGFTVPFAFLALVSLCGFDDAPKPEKTFKATITVRMKCDTSNRSDNPPEVVLHYHFDVDGKNREAKPVTLTNGETRELSAPSKGKKILWKVDNVTRIDGTEICHCGCCVEAGKKCKDDKTTWKTEGTIFDPPGTLKPDPLDLTVNCTCQK